MRDYQKELESRVEFIKNLVKASGCKGIVFGNSGGKDSALVGILCKKACENTVAIIMPCESKRNFEQDTIDGTLLSNQFNITTRTVDLTKAKQQMVEQLSAITTPNSQCLNNIAPRLRMTTLYGVAAAENLLVSGTGNKSEGYMGYFTKWGDGAYDFNPISDLTATEIFEFLRFLDAPKSIIEKAPSAGLFEGQTDEQEMGVTYKAIDTFLQTGEANEQDLAIINRYHNNSEHKRNPAVVFSK